MLRRAKSGHDRQVRRRVFHSSAHNLSFLSMKTRRTDATALHQHLQELHYKFEVVHIHHLHDLLYFLVSDDGPLGPFP